MPSSSFGFLLLGAALVALVVLLWRSLARRRARLALLSDPEREQPSRRFSGTAPVARRPAAASAAAINEPFTPDFVTQVNAVLPQLRQAEPGTESPVTFGRRSTSARNDGAVKWSSDINSADVLAAVQAEADSADDVEEDDCYGLDHRNVMRITKRSSGGRGEYEISEPFGQMTPRDLLGCVLVLDFGEGLQIPTGVRLLDRNGKRRLRIDPSSGGEIHLHRQIAAALLMPHPARDETKWGASQPVLQSGQYGIANISLSDVQLLEKGRVRLAPERVDVTNSCHREQLSCPVRVAEVCAVWAARDAFPPHVAQLLVEHEQLVRHDQPLSEHLERIVARIQQVLASQNRAPSGVDPLPSLLQMMEVDRVKRCSSEAPERQVASIMDAELGADGALQAGAPGKCSPTQQHTGQFVAAAAQNTEPPIPTLPVQNAESAILPGIAAVQENASPLLPVANETPPSTALPGEDGNIGHLEKQLPATVALAKTGLVDDQSTAAAPVESVAQDNEVQGSGSDKSTVPRVVMEQAGLAKQPPTDTADAPGAGPLGRVLPKPALAAQWATPRLEPETASFPDEEQEGPDVTKSGEATLPDDSRIAATTTPRRRVARPANETAPPTPRRYQPTQRGGSASRRAAASADVGDAGESAGVRTERAASIELRFRNERGGTVAVSLLPRRRNGMPAVIDVAGAGLPLMTLSAMRDDWYQDVIPPDLGTVLRRGAEWYADTKEGRLRWSLAGRDLYVLGPSDDWSGPVSRPSLVVGDEHAVLCTQELISEVENLLHRSCGSVPARLTDNDGLPAGWVAYRHVTPAKPLPLGPTPDLLDALRPSPDVQIALRGGIRLRYTQWLAGYPPAIRLYGDAEHAGSLAIDGIGAEVQPDGSFVAQGWDVVGDHLVACAGQTASYSIIQPADDWQPWAAYSFPSLAARGSAPGICGALLVSRDGASRRPLLVPASNPVLLGIKPGQIYRCPIQPDIRLPFCAAFPAFTPKWAIPATPHQADRATARVLLVGNFARPESSEDICQKSPSLNDVRQWYAMILDCSRKGLTVEPGDQETAKAWRSCRSLAKRIWRSSR